MKKKNLKILSILFIFLMTTFFGVNVKTINASSVTGNFTYHEHDSALIPNAGGADGYSGLVQTHKMTVEIGGRTYKAYCAWYSKKPPATGTYTFKALTDEQLPQQYAIGIATILNTKLYKTGSNESPLFCDTNKGGADTPEDCERVLKTTALNLYLSAQGVSAGVNCTNQSNRFIYKNTAADAMRFNGSEYVTADGVDWGQLVFDYYILEGSANVYKGQKDYNTIINNYRNGDIWWKKVAELYDNAVAAQNNYINDIRQQKLLKFKENNSEYILSNGYYQKTYQVEGKYSIQQTTAEVQLVTGNDRNGTLLGSEFVEIIEHANDKSKVTVRIKKEKFESLGQNQKFKIVAKSKIGLKKANVYVSDTNNRCQTQDVVFADYGIDYVNVTTEDSVDTRHCFEMVTNCNNVTCTDSKNNEATCSSSVNDYWATYCEDEDVNAYGELTATFAGGACSLYCTETGTAYYPGNKKVSVLIGTTFEWPTKGAESSYPLITSSTLNCTMQIHDSSKAGLCVNELNNFNYKDGENNAQLIYDDTITDVSIGLERNCVTTSPVYSNFSDIKITRNCEYTLPEGKNTAVNIKTYEFVDNLANAYSNAYTDFLLLTEYNGIIPIGGFSWTASDEFMDATTALGQFDFSEDFCLQIDKLPLGYDGKFTSQLNSSDNPYVCHYNVTTDVSGGKDSTSCLCPPGTKYEGKDVSGLAETCAEAQALYCDDPPPPNDEDITCIDTTGRTRYFAECFAALGTPGVDFPYSDIYKVCHQYLGCSYCIDSNGNTKPYSTCPYTITDGEIEQSCQRYLGCYECPPGNPLCTWYCPDDGDNTCNKDGMEITSCVKTIQIEQNKSESEAYDLCVKSQCSCGGGSGGTGIIIYRTISLENPFPSINSDESVTQSGLSIGMFNDTVKGRYPGANWNSVTTVKQKILENRGYDGSAIYQEAEPLYVIELDAKAIKEIREYNDRQSRNDIGGYGDNTLKCTEGTHCISTFLHNSGIKTSTDIDILAGGTCKNATNAATFADCYKTKGGN